MPVWIDVKHTMISEKRRKTQKIHTLMWMRRTMKEGEKKANVRNQLAYFLFCFGVYLSSCHLFVYRDKEGGLIEMFSFLILRGVWI